MIDSMIDENLKFSISAEVAIEDFNEVSLVFLAEQLRLLEINRTTKTILDQMDGKTSAKDIIKGISAEFKEDKDKIKSDISEIILNMIFEGVIYPEVKFIKNGELNMSKKTKFLVNPDVSCRIEDDDGAILFNPDSDSAQIVNTIGLDIWRALEKLPKTLDEVVSNIKDIYENAPSDDVEKDVISFVKDLHAKGFIGEVVDG